MNTAVVAELARWQGRSVDLADYRTPPCDALVAKGHDARLNLLLTFVFAVLAEERRVSTRIFYLHTLAEQHEADLAQDRADVAAGARPLTVTFDAYAAFVTTLRRWAQEIHDAAAEAALAGPIPTNVVRLRA